MNLPEVNKIVEAVLYEGYILYPYRPSSKKNRQRFTFGRVYPHAYSVAQNAAEPCAIRTECLAISESEDASIEISARFLHVVTREVLALPEPILDLPEALDTASLKVVPQLKVEEQRYSTWQEAIEREVVLPAQIPLPPNGVRCAWRRMIASRPHLGLPGRVPEPVRAAVPQAVEMIRTLVNDLRAPV